MWRIPPRYTRGIHIQQNLEVSGARLSRCITVLYLYQRLRNWVLCDGIDITTVYPDSKVHGATWILSAPDGPHVGLMSFVIRVIIPVILDLGYHIGQSRPRGSTVGVLWEIK